MSTPENAVPLARLKNLSDARVTQDGTFATVRLNATSGESADIEIEVDEMGALIAFLCEVARAAAKNRDHEGKGPKVARNPLYPIEAQGVGFASEDSDLAANFPSVLEPGLGNRQSVLMIRLAGFDLAFRTGNMKVKDVPDWLRASADRIEESIRD